VAQREYPDPAPAIYLAYAMQIASIDLGLQLNAPTKGYVRSPGLHASHLYTPFYEAHDPKRYARRVSSSEDPDLGHERMELGTSFEEVLELKLVERLFGDRPGEFLAPHEDDCPYGETQATGLAPCSCGAGVIFSPDWLVYAETNLTILGEFKCTWKSMRGAPKDPKFDKWITQVKLSCHWLRIVEAYLTIYFVNGDYRENRSPTLKTWHLTFTPSEVREEWLMIRRFAHKRGLLPHGKAA
jgi:hypothetical protein